jgi:predicted CXXCH cytochrome family protein
LLYRLALAGTAIVLLAAAEYAAAADHSSTPPAAPALPRDLARNTTYASSTACQECHADQYASWHRSYHRTMTQVATPQTAAGRFDGSEIDSDGLVYRVFQRNDQLWADMPDPDVMVDRQTTFERKTARGLPVEPLQWRNLPRVQRKVLMSTGSHHYQTYWAESAKYPGTFMTLPLVYLIADQRWIPRESAFLYPPGPERMVTVWNDHCIKCHSTGPVPAPFVETDPQSHKPLRTGFHSQVGEIGIACEACHGPAEEHVRLRRAERAPSGADQIKLIDDPIVHPGKIADHRRSAQVCGQCHGVYIRVGQHALDFRDKGIDYFPGNDLLATRKYLFPPQSDPRFYANEDEKAQAEREYHGNQHFFRQLFWENGDVLSGGREFTALAMSACYIRGEITCLSCHSMHEGQPNDQLIPDQPTDVACQSCHNEPRFNADLATHTHHAAGSSGSKCVNCHMPHNTYALFGAIRSHKIGSPDLDGSATYGVPNACNLCHLDKTLAWTADHLSQWYEYPPPPITDQQRQYSAAALWMLKGHAAQRAITVWHAGWAPALEASGTDWLAPIIAPLLNDPYGVVRYIAAASLRKLPGFVELKYDFMSPPPARTQAVAAVEKLSRTTLPARTGSEILKRPNATPDKDAIKRLLSERDDRPITVNE